MIAQNVSPDLTDSSHDDSFENSRSGQYFISKPKDLQKVLAVRQCVTEINGSTAISGCLIYGWIRNGLQSVSIPPKVVQDNSSALVDGLAVQLSNSGNILSVDRDLDDEIDGLLSKHYMNLNKVKI